MITIFDSQPPGIFINEADSLGNRCSLMSQPDSLLPYRNLKQTVPTKFSEIRNSFNNESASGKTWNILTVAFPVPCLRAVGVACFRLQSGKCE